MKQKSMGLVELPKLGSRFKLDRCVDRFPYFSVNSGATGTVIETGNVIVGKLDRAIPGAKAWDQCIHWQDVNEFLDDTQPISDSSLAKLCDEFEAYCKTHGLPQHSADELVFHGNLTADQRQWLTDFIVRWEHEADIDALRTYLDKNYVRLVTYSGFVAVSPDRKSLFDCPELADGTPEKSQSNPGHLNWGEITAPEDQEFLNAVNRIFGTSFQREDFAGR